MKKFTFFLIIALITKQVKAQNFYALDTIQKIEIFFNAPNWDFNLDTAKQGAEGYTLADSIKINGLKLDSVGVRYKGNSSYSPNFNKNPLRIETNTYKPGQNYFGIEDIKLSNCYRDPSLIREVLAYSILGKYMHAPRANFAIVFINNVYKGVYTNVENLGNAFAKKHFYSDGLDIIKCNPTINPGPTTKSNFKTQIPHDSSSYKLLYQLNDGFAWGGLLALMDSINKPFSNLNNILDLDKAIWMSAFNNVLVNLDSYSGLFAQNHYLFKDNNNLWNNVIWDLNLSFGGFIYAGAGNANLASLSPNTMQNMNMYLHNGDAHWPSLNRIYEDSTSKRQYSAHVKTIAQQILSGTFLQTSTNAFYALIDSFVKADTNKFYTNLDFANSANTDITVAPSYIVPGILNLANGRLNFLATQSTFSNTAPSISNINFLGTPTFGNNQNITIAISNANKAWLNFKHGKDKRFENIPLYDDGLHNDGAAGDNTWGAAYLPLSDTTYYYIYAENNNAGKFAPEEAAYKFYTQPIVMPIITAGIKINELMANNTFTALDNNGNYDDWVELAVGTYPFTLGNLYLTDDAANLKKWKFPNDAVMKSAQENYAIVWCDNEVLQKGWHANFRLNDSASVLILTNANGFVLDSVYWTTSIAANNSLLRCGSVFGTNAALNLPVSFNAQNCIPQTINSKADNKLVMFPNPSNGVVFFNGLAKNTSLKISNIYGTVVYNKYVDGNAIVNTQNWQSGVYFVAINGGVIKLLVE